MTLQNNTNTVNNISDIDFAAIEKRNHEAEIDDLFECLDGTWFIAAVGVERDFPQMQILDWKLSQGEFHPVEKITVEELHCDQFLCGQTLMSLNWKLGTNPHEWEFYNSWRGQHVFLQEGTYGEQCCVFFIMIEPIEAFLTRTGRHEHGRRREGLPKCLPHVSRRLRRSGHRQERQGRAHPGRPRLTAESRPAVHQGALQHRPPVSPGSLAASDEENRAAGLG